MSQGHGFFRADLPASETGDAGIGIHDRKTYFHFQSPFLLNCSSYNTHILQLWLEINHFPQNPDEIDLEKHFAKFQKAALGDRFQVGEKAFTVTGLVEIKEGPQVPAANIYTPLDAARDLFKGKLDSVNLFYLKLEDPSMLNRVKSEILR